HFFMPPVQRRSKSGCVHNKGGWTPKRVAGHRKSAPPGALAAGGALLLLDASAARAFLVPRRKWFSQETALLTPRPGRTPAAARRAGRRPDSTYYRISAGFMHDKPSDSTVRPWRQKSMPVTPHAIWMSDSVNGVGTPASRPNEAMGIKPVGTSSRMYRCISVRGALMPP